jgi:hypothetical protein
VLERTTVTPARHAATGGAALSGGVRAAAIEVADRGDWDARFTADDPRSSAPFAQQRFWAEWVDRGDGYKSRTAVCNDTQNAATRC